MEIFNKNKVTLPALPTTGASAKEKLAHEIATCIIAMMNRNGPEQMGQAWLSVVHHGNKEKQVSVTVAEGFSHDHTRRYTSGSKVFESVLEELSKVSKIDRVSIQVSPLLFVGVFSPDSTKDDPVKKVKEVLARLQKEKWAFTDVRWTAECRGPTGELLGVGGGEVGRVWLGKPGQKKADIAETARDILETIGNRPRVTLYFGRGGGEISAELF